MLVKYYITEQKMCHKKSENEQRALFPLTFITMSDLDQAEDDSNKQTSEELSTSCFSV